MVLIILALSFGCKPMLGSSSTYNMPMSPEPICVERRIRFEAAALDLFLKIIADFRESAYFSRLRKIVQQRAKKVPGLLFKISVYEIEYTLDGFVSLGLIHKIRVDRVEKPRIVSERLVNHFATRRFVVQKHSEGAYDIRRFESGVKVMFRESAGIRAAESGLVGPLTNRIISGIFCVHLDEVYPSTGDF